MGCWALWAELARAGGSAADQHGRVTFNGLPVPGATIVATQRRQDVRLASDSEGRYRLTGLDDGPYSIRVEMLGFAPMTHEVVAGDDTRQRGSSPFCRSTRSRRSPHQQASARRRVRQGAEESGRS